jgi:tetratricopeptide (TPR) repeat protein
MAAKKKSQSRRQHNAKPKEMEISFAANDLIKRAKKLYLQNRNEQALELLKSVSIDDLEANMEDKLWYLRLTAFSLTNLGKFHEAEKFVIEGLELNKNDLDLSFVMAFLGIGFRDYNRCIEYGDKYLDLYRSNQATQLQGFLSVERRPVIYNIMGAAYRAVHNSEKAEEYFAISIKLDKANSHPYVNLANLYIQQRNYEKAETIVSQGLKNCSQIQELRILKEVLKNKTTVSVCMIVKNEEELLSNCLESIRNWVDEIIVVDTGSTDRTVAIAESYGAKIYHQKWEGDFSKARNLSLAKANSDWIFVIDADEEFVQEDISLLRQAMAQEKFRLIAINVYNMNRETGECTSFLPSYRLFRRSAEFYYEGIVHNQLKYNANEAALRVGAGLKHYGYSLTPEKMKKKIARSRELLERQLNENPDDAYIHFNYAQLLRGSGPELEPEICDLIIKHATKAIELSENKIETQLNTHLMAHHQLITTHLYLKNYHEAEQLCYRALALKPNYLDPILSLGQIYSHLRELDKADEYYNKYLEMQASYNESEETTNFILLYLKARHVAYYGLAIIAHFKGELDKAERYYKNILNEYGPYLDTYIRLGRIYLDRSEMEQAQIVINKELERDSKSDMGNLYMFEYLVRIQNIPEAEKYLLKALSNAGENREVYEKAGCFYANQKRFESAIPLLEKVVAIKSQYGNGLRLLGKAYYDAGYYAKAEDIYQRYLEIAPSDSEILNDLANCYFKSREFEKAEDYYQKALALNHNLGVIYRNLGLTKMHLGRTEDALTLLERYNAISPEDLEIEMAIGGIFCQTGHFAEAIPHYEKYLAANLNSVEALFEISECYYFLGHTDSALIGYNQVLKINPKHEKASGRLQEVTRRPALV